MGTLIWCIQQGLQLHLGLPQGHRRALGVPPLGGRFEEPQRLPSALGTKVRRCSLERVRKTCRPGQVPRTRRVGYLGEVLGDRRAELRQDRLG
jgi:hypothetical protein